jgi:hypothetical protein
VFYLKEVYLGFNPDCSGTVAKLENNARSKTRVSIFHLASTNILIIWLSARTGYWDPYSSPHERWRFPPHSYVFDPVLRYKQTFLQRRTKRRVKFVEKIRIECRGDWFEISDLVFVTCVRESRRPLHRR